MCGTTDRPDAARGADGLARAARRGRLAPLALTALVLLGTSAGCVRRTIQVTSDPPGALLLVNDHEMGRTPLEFEFTWYGRYDVRLHLDGYEPYVGSANAEAPIWDWAGPDLVAELLPMQLDSRIAWHFDLEPSRSAGLIDRAEALRAETVAGADATPTAQPATP